MVSSKDEKCIDSSIIFIENYSKNNTKKSQIKANNVFKSPS